MRRAAIVQFFVETTVYRVVVTDTRRVPWAESPLVPDVNDVFALLQLGIKSAEFHSRYLRDSYSAEPGDAIRYEDELQPGKYKIIFRTMGGVETCYRGLLFGGSRPAAR